MTLKYKKILKIEFEQDQRGWHGPPNIAPPGDAERQSAFESRRLRTSSVLAGSMGPLPV